MLAFLDQPSDADVFRLHLCYELGKTPAEVDQIPHADYLLLSSYAKAKTAIENKRAVT